MNEINSADQVTDSSIAKREDEAFYALSDSPIGFKNKVQSCLAQFPISKIDRDDSIFTDYRVTLGCRLFAGKDDTSPTDLGQTEFDVTVDSPDYDDFDFDPEEEVEYGEIEMDWVYIQDFMGEDQDTTAALGVAGESYTNLYIEFEINKEYSRPDMVNFWFYAGVPTTAVQDGDKVFQWVNYTPQGSPESMTIGCQTTIGDSSDYSIKEWIGTDSFASADVANMDVSTIYDGSINTDSDVRSTYKDYDYESWVD